MSITKSERPVFDASDKDYVTKLKEWFIENDYTIDDLVKDFQKWYEIEKEDLEIILSGVSDRYILPDTKMWFELINRSGALKSELSKILEFCNTYSLDSLTEHTLVSGKAYKDKATGKMVPVMGLLPEIDGKVLIIKDGAMLLTKHPDQRNEIFGQLRTLSDGYIEIGCGNFPNKIRVEGKIGLILCATPFIDKFTVMQSLLGERFLRLRMNFDSKKIMERIRLSIGNEENIRTELGLLTSIFLQAKVDFGKLPTISDFWMKRIEDLALYIGKMRTQIDCEWFKGEIVAIINEPNEELPSRLYKQLIKLGYLLTLIRGKKEFGQEEFDSLIRVGEDTISPYTRSRILKCYLKNNYRFSTQEEIAEKIKVSQKCVFIHLQMMEGCQLIDEDYELTKETKELMMKVYNPELLPLTEQSLQPEIVKKEIL